MQKSQAAIGLGKCDSLFSEMYFLWNNIVNDMLNKKNYKYWQKIVEHYCLTKRFTILFQELHHYSL